MKLLKTINSKRRIYHNYRYRTMDSASQYEVNRKKYLALELTTLSMFGFGAYLLFRFFL